MQLVDLLRSKELLLLDFDGPITRLMPPPVNMQVAARVRRPFLSRGIALPPPLGDGGDPIALIRYAARYHPGILDEVEVLCRDAEVGAAARSKVGPGLKDLLSVWTANRGQTAIVTNNAPEAVTKFLAVQGIHVEGLTVHGRLTGHPELMKPHTYMLTQALTVHATPASSSILIGDQASDILAACRAGVTAVGLAKDARRAAELQSAGALTIVRSVSQLLVAED
ncbi:MAG: HAD family hydrolase [Dermatophilaceae bacterium]